MVDETYWITICIMYCLWMNPVGAVVICHYASFNGNRPCWCKSIVHLVCWVHKVSCYSLVLVLCVQDEDSMEDVCKQIIKQWTDYRSRLAAKKDADGISVTLIYPHSSYLFEMFFFFSFFFSLKRPQQLKKNNNMNKSKLSSSWKYNSERTFTSVTYRYTSAFN